MKPLLVCLICFCCASPMFAATSVALVGSSPGEKEAQAIALAAADLNADKDLQIVKTQEIDSALHSQKLTLAGLAETYRLIQVARLLKTDLFAVVEVRPDGGTLGIVIFDSTTGVRLADLALAPQPDKAAVTIAAAVRAAAVKGKILGNGVRVVGFFQVRNVDLPPERDIFCDTVRVLLERQLAGSPGIGVLERDRLEFVNKQRQLPTAQDGADIWPSVVLVQLEISRKPDGGGLSASATLTDGSGHAIDKLQAVSNKDSAADLADELRPLLIQSLKVQNAVGKFDRGREAGRFAADADVLTHNSRYAEGLAAAEAAYALQPSDNFRQVLSTALWMRALQYLTPDQVGRTLQVGWLNPIDVPADKFDHSLALAARSLELQTETLRLKQSIPIKDQHSHDYTGDEQRMILLLGYGARLNAVQNVDPHLDARVAAFRAAGVSYVLAYYDGWGKLVENNSAELTFYSGEILKGLQTLGSLTMGFTEFSDARDRLIHRWLESFEKTWSHQNDIWLEAGLRQSNFMRTLLVYRPSDRWKDCTQDAWNKCLKPIADDLAQSTSPVMRMYGAMASALTGPEGASSTPEAREKSFAALTKQLQETLDKPGPTPRQTRNYAYIAAVDGIEILLQRDESSTDAAIQLLELAVRRKELLPSVALYRIGLGLRIDVADNHMRQWLDALEKTMELSDAANCVVLDGNADGLRQALTEEIHKIHQAHLEYPPEKLARPWESAKRLVDLAMLPGISQIESATVRDGWIYLVGLGSDGPDKFFVQGFILPLGGGQIKSLAKMPATPLRIPGVGGYFPLDGFTYVLIQGAAVDADNLYVSVREQGVVVFPLNGGAALRIDKTNGLATDWAQSLIASGGFLYIACSGDSGAYVTQWNPKDHAVSVLVSSLRKEKKSPLDDTPNMRIAFMVEDAPRRRFLIGVVHHAGRGGIKWEQCRGGLWEFDPAKGTMKHMLTVSDGGMGLYIGMDEELLIAANTVWCVEFDLRKNEGHYLSFRPGGSPYFIREFFPDNAVKGSGWSEPRNAREGTRMVLDRWLWIGSPLTRVSADAHRVQLLDPQFDPKNPPLGPVWIIEPIGKTQALVGDREQLYLLTLRKP